MLEMGGWASLQLSTAAGIGIRATWMGLLASELDFSSCMEADVLEAGISAPAA